ncbi:MAG: hypothetical protein M3512_18225 [Bacteroidota bacterium]|nr:hypothetical protein [Bacteroidota bacterium]
MLSHAHTDHSGLIPLLVKNGFSGPIYCTPPTLELCKLLFRDSAKIQYFEWKNASKEAKNPHQEEPLFAEEDVVGSLKLFRPVPYENLC